MQTSSVSRLRAGAKYHQSRLLPKSACVVMTHPASTLEHSAYGLPPIVATLSSLLEPPMWAFELGDRVYVRTTFIKSWDLALESIGDACWVWAPAFVRGRNKLVKMTGVGGVPEWDIAYTIEAYRLAGGGGRLLVLWHDSGAIQACSSDVCAKIVALGEQFLGDPMYVCRPSCPK